MQRHPNVFPCFSPETGKRSRGFAVTPLRFASFGKAGDLGFEPRLSDPESLVLPLHQSPSRLGMSRSERSKHRNEIRACLSRVAASPREPGHRAMRDRASRRPRTQRLGLENSRKGSVTGT